VELHELGRHREAEPEPALGASRRAVGLPESVKRVGQELVADACAVVDDAHLELARVASHGQSIRRST
jgi:hypothetical protein